jgi:hypothetical protein
LSWSTEEIEPSALVESFSFPPDYSHLQTRSGKRALSLNVYQRYHAFARIKLEPLVSAISGCIELAGHDEDPTIHYLWFKDSGARKRRQLS